ncbi:hypothetical protein DIU31_007175 [Mucilaginibacter rubeus]|uniref:Uncharacterized protein n=1 Tax=Mucilaginibacter rubeus TaxID=2027860 RepID=A0AAE6JCR1_9SPHI|nr:MULTISPECIES: hypothetical protein [Mucilaginibacter]QEM03314.1 hypothetical protein DIU31_007175 [Mucilaginibacter rubeus]QEM15932.1 hypothetical protein DIU38_007255 [Mucilaginibacter gossypii]QTE41324.1 hypothetical protein J3L19_20500 [Mucilaginibacter rubeus]QTE47928.1 hypothetical protein J3L21_20485 [Mucilaginibacter rubeus]QTE59321.1 hypothetical protein J3L23_12155 [Mucilaginibacter rubeus]
MPNEDIFFIALKKGAEKGLYSPVDITPEFRALIRTIYSDHLSAPHNWHQLPTLFFKDFADLDYIRYVPIYDHPLDDTPVPDNWIDVISVQVILQPSGLLFYNQWNQMKVQERANKLSTRNIVATFVLAGLGFLVSFGSFIKSFFDKSDKQQLQELSQQLQQQKQLLSTMQKNLNQEDYRSHSESAKKPSK